MALLLLLIVGRRNGKTYRGVREGGEKRGGKFEQFLMINSRDIKKQLTVRDGQTDRQTDRVIHYPPPPPSKA